MGNSYETEVLQLMHAIKATGRLSELLNLILMFLLELVKLAIHQVFTQNCLENTKGKDLTEHVT